MATNAVDPQAGRPLTPERIRSALDQAHVNIKNAPDEGIYVQIQKQLHDLDRPFDPITQAPPEAGIINYTPSYNRDSVRHCIYKNIIPGL